MNKTIKKLRSTAVWLVLCLLPGLQATGQINGIVKSDTADGGGVVQFANVQILDQNQGTTTDEQGRFSLPETDRTATLVISATGYKPLYTRLSEGGTYRLQRSYAELQEVIVNKNRKGLVLKTGSFKKSDVRLHFSANGIPWILVRYFPFEDAYRNTPFLKSLMIETQSEVADAIFNVRLYRKGSDGLPGEFFTNEQIIGHAQKGKQYTLIELSNYNLVMPADGLYIAIEFLHIAQNQYTTTYTDMSTKKKHTEVQYAPSIGVLPSDTGENAMVFMKGKWQPMWRNGTAMFHKTYKDKYNIFAMELTLVD